MFVLFVVFVVLVVSSLVAFVAWPRSKPKKKRTKKQKSSDSRPSPPVVSLPPPVISPPPPVVSPPPPVVGPPPPVVSPPPPVVSPSPPVVSPPTGSCGYDNNRPPNGNNQIGLDDQEAINRQFLSDHNHYRRLHGAPELKRENSTQKQLETSAKAVADSCVFAHTNIPYGENLATGFSGPTSVTNAWYDEHRLYDRNKPIYSPQTGHFTQLVWTNSSTIGCAAAYCPGGVKDGNGNLVKNYKNMYACHYWPPGNFQSQYSTNVRCRN
jgi:uncharacterized protein YkwD